MAVVVITREVARFLIERDTNSARFQRFCVDLLSAAEHVQYISSAPSFDLGRDGRTALLGGGALDAVICCSVKHSPAKAVAKAKADFDRLIETGLPRRVAFCFTCELQESHKDQIKQYISEEKKILEVRCRAEGVEFLADCGARHPDIVEQHYRGEWLALRQSLLADDAAALSTTNGLRIVMATQFGEDSELLRLAAMKNLIRLTLLGREAITRNALRQRMSEELGLLQQVNAAYLDAAIAELRDIGEVHCSGNTIQLASSGKDAAVALVAEGRVRLLDGRQTFREEIERSSAQALSDSVFDDLWFRLQDTLADLFMHEGMAVVRAILDPVQESPEFANGTNPLAKLAVVSNSNDLSPSEALALARRAVGVLTSDTKTRAWLSQVAAIFTSICALGLHPEAQQELLNKLQTWSILADTHVLLSFLCSADDDHDGVDRIIEAWRKLGREITTSEAVLEEAAYHAFVVADAVYEEWWRRLPELTKEQARILIPNAFVRSFHAMSGPDGYNPTRWKSYMSNFRGENESDGSAIKQVLVAKGWGIVRDSQFKRQQIQELNAALSNEPAHGTALAHTRRLDWDIRIALGALARLRMKAESGGNVIIATKSRAIRRAAAHFRRNSMGDLSVMSVAALGYAMSLTPGLSITLADIRELLFDRGRLSQAFGQLESVARRVAEQDKSEGYDLIEKPQMERPLTAAFTAKMRRIDENDPQS